LTTIPRLGLPKINTRFAPQHVLILKFQQSTYALYRALWTIKGLLREPLNYFGRQARQMKRHAIFVDAGYVFAQGSVSLLGRNSPRSRLKLNEFEIVRQLKVLAQQQSPGVSLLRVYWYDGARNGPTIDHLELANMEDVKYGWGQSIVLASRRR